MDLDHMNDAEFMAWFEREYPPDENGNRTRYRDTMVMDLMRAAYRAERVVPAQASAPEVDDLAALVARLVRALRTAAPGHDLPEKALDYLKRKGLTGSALRAAPVPAQDEPRKFQLGDQVRKTKGSQWHGRVVGQYATELTPEGYAVESSTERGSVQIYPAAALELVSACQPSANERTN